MTTSIELPDLQGPQPLMLVWEDKGKWHKGRAYWARPLSFRWWQDSWGCWHEDTTHGIPMTLPKPRPDYTSEEQAKIRAAEEKRTKRANQA